MDNDDDIIYITRLMLIYLYMVKRKKKICSSPHFSARVAWGKEPR